MYAQNTNLRQEGRFKFTVVRENNRKKSRKEKGALPPFCC